MKMFDDVGKNFLELPIPFYAQMEIIVKDVCTYYRTCEKQRKAILHNACENLCIYHCE